MCIYICINIHCYIPVGHLPIFFSNGPALRGPRVRPPNAKRCCPRRWTLPRTHPRNHGTTKVIITITDRSLRFAV